METENNTVNSTTTAKNILTAFIEWLKKFSLREILNGKLLTEDFFIKQSKLLFMIFCLIIVFISFRYCCAKRITEMDNLKAKLSRLQNEQVDLNKNLTTISRQARIEELLKEKGIELTKGNTTVYQIQK